MILFQYSLGKERKYSNTQTAILNVWFASNLNGYLSKNDSEMLSKLTNYKNKKKMKKRHVPATYAHARTNYAFVALCIQTFTKIQIP